MSMRVAFVAGVGVITIVCFVADLWFWDLFDPPGILAMAFPLLSFAVVGSLLVVRRAGGPIGWLLGTVGALAQVLGLSQAYGYASLYAGAALPGGELAVWLGSVIGNALIAFIISALVRFPDGRPPNRVFAVLMWAAIALIAIPGTVVYALADLPILVPLTYTGLHAGALPRSIPNPFAVHGQVGDLLLLASSVLNYLAPAVLIAPLSLAVRLRRSRSVEREQLKWLTYTAAITFGLMVIGYVIPPGPLNTLVEAPTVLGIGLLPVAIGIAIMRYHLYAIDVLIRRTLIYAAVSAVLLVAYIGGVALFQTILAPLTSGSGVAVAISTLAVVALFQPVRTRIQAAVDRRFYRRKYDAERTLDAFAARLRDQVDLGALEGELLAVVDDTMRPAQANVWLRKVAP
jgi:hypothetical protein